MRAVDKYPTAFIIPSACHLYVTFYSPDWGNVRRMVSLWPSMRLTYCRHLEGGKSELREETNEFV